MVYFIQALEGGPIKIGYTSSKSAKNRLANLQTAHAQKLVVLATTERHEEADLHERFKSLRLAGEWFKPAPTLVAWIQRNARVTEEGHRLLAKPSRWKEATDEREHGPS